MQPGGSPPTRWPADPRAQYLLGTLYLAGLGVGEDRNVRGLSSRPRQPRASHARRMHWQRLRRMTRPQTNQRHGPGSHKAAAAGHADAARLLQAGQLPLQVDPRVLATEPAVTLSMTIAAARRGDVDTLAALWPLLPKDANDAFRRSVLHHAAESGAAESVRWLVAHGARVDAIDAQGITPLMLAATAERADALEVLLQSQSPTLPRSTRSGTRLCSTRHAVAASHSPSAWWLRASIQSCAMRVAGAPWITRCNQDRTRSPATWSSKAHNRRAGTRRAPVPAQGRLAQFFARAAGDAYAGWPDVALAASRSDPAMLKSALARGGDPEATTSAGQPALHVAIAASSPATVGVLLAAGASPTRPDRAGHTPLGVAVSQGRKDIVQMLLERGANPNEHGASDSAPLTDRRSPG